jgi:hypothetical protein
VDSFVWFIVGWCEQSNKFSNSKKWIPRITQQLSTSLALPKVPWLMVDLWNKDIDLQWFRLLNTAYTSHKYMPSIYILCWLYPDSEIYYVLSLRTLTSVRHLSFFQNPYKCFLVYLMHLYWLSVNVNESQPFVCGSSS